MINDILNINNVLWIFCMAIKIFMEFLEAFDKDVGYDWFHEYFQDEHANRKNHKQDFTPQSISKLLVEIVDDTNGSYYEPAAGTGGIIIEKWNETLTF